MALTAKMKAFAQAVVDGLSNKDAAISAGYSEKSAKQQGSKLAKIPEVIAYIDQFKSVKKLTPTTQKLTPKKQKVNSVDSGENDNPSVLALAIGSVLVGCGGGGGGGLAATSSHITQPPTRGENNPGSGGQDTGTGGEQNPNSAYIYDPQKFNVEEPDTSLNKVGVGVLDSGVGINDYLEDSVKKFFVILRIIKRGLLHVKI